MTILLALFLHSIFFYNNDCTILLKISQQILIIKTNNKSDHIDRKTLSSFIKLRKERSDGPLLRRPLVLAPAVEALGEPARLLVLQSEEQLPRFVWLHCLHVLNIHLENKLLFTMWIAGTTWVWSAQDQVHWHKGREAYT